MNPTVPYRYSSLDDFLKSKRLDVDGLLDDGWGAKFAVKGREIEAAVLFADISAFSARTYDLAPIETLIFVNNFFAWITAEAVRMRPCIVDKYIGDEVMIVFSKEFGSEDPFLDAVQAARFMSENDALSFCPHIGIAAGQVVIGYVGTPVKYNCSVFGRPETIAARCASVAPTRPGSTSIIFPADLWKGRKFEEVFPPVKYSMDNKLHEKSVSWEVLPSRMEKVKNMPDIEVTEIANHTRHIPSTSPAERARMGLEVLKKEGSYYRCRYDFER